LIEAGSAAQRMQTRGEELANSLSHGLGFLAVLAAFPLLVMNAIPRGAAAVVGASLFAASAALLYLTSTLYHAVPHPRAKHVFRTMDHGAIYLLIAGTYSPFTLGVLRGPWGWSLFGAIWGLAAIGVLMKSFGRLRPGRISTGLYLAMGWLIVVAAWPMWSLMPRAGIVWLTLGGLAYTAGVAFYAAKRVRYSHFVWHLFVLGGTSCHFVAVLRYAA
jgi:hemolysin III